MNFDNENLLPGNLGYLCIIIAFVASIVSCIAYFKSANSISDASEAWRKLGRQAYYTHFAGLLGVFGTLFYLIFTHHYEYYYVWSHSSNQLPFKFLLSCFWEGQEGSFLLWLIWHGLLGSLLTRSSKTWEAPVMTTVAAVQIIITATILGFNFFEFKIGSSPFVLLRQQMQNAPIFTQPDYMKFITDGKGLNPLLQNYWMVIHPPVLFMGFASTLIPFAYAIAGLWKKNFTNWVAPTLAWGVFSIMILGLGIMMGGAWAYESLSFGGYWAWDPVENASLVPWLIMVAGVHTLNIYKHSKYSLKTTLIFFMLSFFLIIYSTYLTRTGILGDTSVHAFTGEGASLSYHLILFLLLISIISSVLYFKNKKTIDAPVQEEATWTREFWLYIGALILLISAFQITLTTSIPVWVKLFSWLPQSAKTFTKYPWAPPEDPMMHYNRIQIWVAVLLALGTAFVHFLKYKNTSILESLKAQLWPFLASLLLSVFVCYTQTINSYESIILAWATCYAVTGNIFYLIKTKIKHISKMGASIAHVGFGLMLLGILLSSFNKHVISFNKLNTDLGLVAKAETKDPKQMEKVEQLNRKENQENILLFRNTPVEMQEYAVTYIGDSVVEPNHYYKIKYTVKDPKTNIKTDEFILYPNAQVNPKMGLVTSPGTKHYWNRDIFTYVTKTIDKTSLVDTVSYSKQTVKPNDTIYFADGYLIYKGISKTVTNKNFAPQPNDIAICAQFDLFNIDGKVATAEPVYYVRGNTENRIEDTIANYNLYVRLAKLNLDADQSIDVEFKQPSAQNDYVVLKALVFPHINIVGIGGLIMIIGSLIAMFLRIKQTKL
jgi:cytochrome c-type biogenesis protein CcmF